MRHLRRDVGGHLNFVRFEVRGNPVTQGSMKAFVPRGARFPVVTHSNPKTTEWRNLIALEARKVAPPNPWRGPVLLDVTFRLQRPKSHYGAKNVKPSAPSLPAGRPDCDKLLRGLGDALSGVIYADDAQLVEISVRKEYGPAGAVIELRHLETP